MKFCIALIIIFITISGCSNNEPIKPAYPTVLSMKENGKHINFISNLYCYDFGDYLRLEGTANNRQDILVIWIFGFNHSQFEYGTSELYVEVLDNNYLFYAGGENPNAGSGKVTFSEIDENHVKGTFEITTGITTYETDPGVIDTAQLIITDGVFDFEKN